MAMWAITSSDRVRGTQARAGSNRRWEPPASHSPGGVIQVVTYMSVVADELAHARTPVTPWGVKGVFSDSFKKSVKPMGWRWKARAFAA